MNSEQFSQWCQNKTTMSSFAKKKPLVMGILNITPNSFSDGGLFLQPERAYDRAMMLINQGVDVIDIGGESTKPGAEPVRCDEELCRVIPVIEAIRKVSDVCLSIDTSKPEVMKAAVEAGASMINDINALRTPGAVEIAAQLNVPICLMHMQGTPQSMQINPHYSGDIIDEINLFFEERINASMLAGISRQNLILDPGFGFGKTVQHNLSIVRRLRDFQRHECPLLMGVSRKSTLGFLLNSDVSQRLAGGIAMLVFAAMQGLSIIRTHDVQESMQALNILHAIIKEESLERGMG